MRKLFTGFDVSVAAIVIVASASRDGAASGPYSSPYEVRYSHPVAELVGDIEHGPRGNIHDESEVPFAQWYSKPVRSKWGSWGPPARPYPAPNGVAGKPAEWQRERVIAVAMRFRGYEYQHHHVPDWNPPSDWPWKEVKSGHNAKGVDCSNFTAFVYNQGFGIKPSGAVKEQAEQAEISGPNNHAIHAVKIEKPKAYADFAKVLKTGDLLYINNRSGELSHVVIWVGAIGHSPDNKPLILDSHGDGVKDSKGTTIPAGVHLRPFVENSWYHTSASHAHRIIADK